MHSVKKKIKKDEYRNWVKSTLGLERTNRALYGYVKKKFALFTHKRVGPGVHFTQDEFNHIHGGQGCIRTSLTTKIKYSRQRQQWEWKTKCDKCTSVFDKILSLHRKPTEKGIHWQNSHDTSNITLDWAIAKMFMPEGNEKNTGPGDTDISAMISMMLNCKLFNNSIRPYHSKELRKARNDLFHSTDNLISDIKMETYFDSMGGVLTDASNDNDVGKKIGRTIKEDIDKVEKLKESEMTMTLFDDALKIKRKAIYEDFETCLSNNDLDQLKLLLQLAENVAEDLQYMSDHIDEIRNIELYKNKIEHLQSQKTDIINNLQSSLVKTQELRKLHKEFKTEVVSMLQNYIQFENSHFNDVIEECDRKHRSQNEVMDRMRDHVKFLSWDLSELQQQPNEKSVFTQGMMRLKNTLCFFWQAIRDSVYALDVEGIVIIVIFAIWLAIVSRLVFLFV